MVLRMKNRIYLKKTSKKRERYLIMYLKALKIAYNAHKGQKRSNGVPYIIHPLRVAKSLDDDMEKSVAVLHDVLEDTEITLKDLKKLSPFIAEKINILTHKEGEDYFDYIRRIKKDDLCIKIKMLDIIDNLSDNPKNIEKYNKALGILINNM